MENKHYPSGDTSEHSIFVTREVRDMVIEKYHAPEGGKQTLARMGEYLKTIGA
jgi:hypothetical protein